MLRQHCKCDVPLIQPSTLNTLSCGNTVYEGHSHSH